MHFFPLPLAPFCESMRKRPKRTHKNALATANECRNELTNDLQCAKKDFFPSIVICFRKIFRLWWENSKTRSKFCRGENNIERELCIEIVAKLSDFTLSLAFSRFLPLFLFFEQSRVENVRLMAFEVHIIKQNIFSRGSVFSCNHFVKQNRSRFCWLKFYAFLS